MVLSFPGIWDNAGTQHIGDLSVVSTNQSSTKIWRTSLLWAGVVLECPGAGKGQLGLDPVLTVPFSPLLLPGAPEQPQLTLKTFLAQVLKDSSWPQSSSPSPMRRILSPPSSSRSVSTARAKAQKWG